MKPRTLLILSGLSLFLLGGCKKSQTQLEVEQLSRACAKQAVVGAKPYARGPGPHPLMVFDNLYKDKYSRAYGRLTSKTPTGKDLATTELALCTERAVEQEVETCQFERQLRVGLVRVPGAKTEGPSFPRIAISKKARIVAVASGETIVEKTFEGSAAPQCDHSIVGHPTAGDFRGGNVSDRDIDAWAESYAQGQLP